MDGFASSFEGADRLILAEVYPAGEANPRNLSARQLAERVPRAEFCPDFECIRGRLEEIVGEGDLLLFMGAGDIGRLARELAE